MKYFTYKEFDNRGTNTDLYTVDPKLGEVLDTIREHYGVSVTITSGARSLWNQIHIYQDIYKGNITAKCTTGQDITAPYWQAKFTSEGRHLYQLYANDGSNNKDKVVQDYLTELKNFKERYLKSYSYVVNGKTISVPQWKLLFPFDHWANQFKNVKGLLTAADIIVKDVKSSDVQDYCKTLKLVGGIGLNSSFTHVDTRPRINGEPTVWVY